MRVFYDTEFTDLKRDAELISAGFVADNGREFYAELTDFNPEICSDFVNRVVLPLLDGDAEIRMSRPQLAEHLREWLRSIDDHIILISDSEWDSSFIAALYRNLGGVGVAMPGVSFRLLEMPQDDVQRTVFAAAYKNYFKKNQGRQHHALHDARALRRGVLCSEGGYC